MVVLVDEARIAFGHGREIRHAALAVIERFPQRRDTHLDVVFLDNEARPNASHQLVFADHFAVRAGKHAKNIEGAIAERD